MSVLLQTSLGSIVIDLFTKEAPEESNNFIKLCKAKYYQFSPFHDIQKEYYVSLGNPDYPLRKEGTSAEGLAGGARGFKTQRNKLRHDKVGRVSYVVEIDQHDPNSLYASSIINVTLGEFDEKRTRLSKNVVFGQVSEGLEVLTKINHAIVDDRHDPLQDIRVHHIVVLEDPFEPLEGLQIPPCTPEPSQEQISTIRLAEVEHLDLEPVQETEEEIKRKNQKEADSKALTLEIIGDLPSAEVKPMENVLFVCKLNSITKSEDLEIIFARFGKIISCEVIKDPETGQSLQYAFVEFEEKKSCEAAYFKMDGVLIDDRRIHVDFSQSVSKLADAWKNKTNEMRKHHSKGLSKSSDKGENHHSSSELRERPDHERDDRHYRHQRLRNDGDYEETRNYRRSEDERGNYDRNERDRYPDSERRRERDSNDRYRGRHGSDDRKRYGSRSPESLERHPSGGSKSYNPHRDYGSSYTWSSRR